MTAIATASQISTKSLISELKQSALAPRLALPDAQEFRDSLTSYFSQQEQGLQPALIILPESAEDIALAVKAFSKHHTATPEESPRFAVRSGGKNPIAGIANIHDGITLDLCKIKQVTVSNNRQTVEIGSGAKWGDVYPILDAQGLGIAGGRDATIGVGGLTLSGGISYFSPQRGFVCDDVVAFEVVLADGKIVEASQRSNSDLWRALKGGSNNFGIVTKLTFRSFDIGEIWGGQNVYPIETASHHLDALYEFASNTSPDPSASVIQSFAIYQGNVIINEGLTYTKPVERPAIFDRFLAIKPVIYSSNKTKTIAATAIEQAGFNQLGRRQALLTTTFVNDRDTLQHAFDAWNESVPSVKDMAGVQWSITFQPLTPNITQKGVEREGNVLGLEGAPALVPVNIAISWDDAAHDDILIGKAVGILESIDRFAESTGNSHRYRYLNYAWSTQDPLAGYGHENVEFMRRASKKYDPHGLFQAGFPGGFKLFK